MNAAHAIGVLNTPPAALDYRELVITELADSEARLRERVALLEADVTIYAALAKQALQLLHEKNVACDRQQARVLALVGDLRLAHADVRAMGAQLRARQERAA